MNVTSKVKQAAGYLIEANFYFAVFVLISGGLLSLSDRSVFAYNEALYGALDNNLRIIMVYLALTEAVVVAYCFFSKRFHFMILVGFFLLLMMGSLDFYGEVNTIEIDSDFTGFFLYTGLSHVVYGVFKTDASWRTHSAQ